MNKAEILHIEYQAALRKLDTKDVGEDFPLTPPNIEILSEPCDSCGA